MRGGVVGLMASDVAEVQSGANVKHDCMRLGYELLCFVFVTPAQLSCYGLKIGESARPVLIRSIVCVIGRDFLDIGTAEHLEGHMVEFNTKNARRYRNAVVQ